MRFSLTASTVPASIRAQVALDLVLHGTPFILLEFGLGVLLPSSMGLVLLHHRLHHSHPDWLVMPLGWLLLGVALNYLPLLLYGIHVVRVGSAQQLVAIQLGRSGDYLHRSPAQQLPLLLVPGALVLVAVRQEWRLRRRLPWCVTQVHRGGPWPRSPMEVVLAQKKHKAEAPARRSTPEPRPAFRPRALPTS